MSIKVIAKIHPLDPTQRVVKDVDRAPLDRLYADLGVALPLDYARFMVGDRIITDPSFVPDDGETVYIVVVPGGGSTQDSGKAMGWAGAAMIAAGIAVSFMSFGLATPLGAVMIGSGVSMMLGGVVLYNYEIPDLTSGSRDQIEQASNLRGGRNKTNADGPTPLILGRHRIYPHNGADAYTEISGNEQYLHQLLVVGQKDLQVESGSWKIGDTDATEFDDWAANVIQNGSNPAQYPKVVTEVGIGREIVKIDEDGNDGSIVITTPTKTNEILIDILFNGLVWFDKDGDKREQIVSIRALYKKSEAPDSSYESLGQWFDHELGTLLPSNQIRGSTTKTKRLTIHKVLDNSNPSGSDYSESKKYDVKLQRITSDSNKTTVIDSAYWMALRAIKNLRPIPNEVQKDLTVAAFTVKASNQFNNALDQVSCVAQLKARDYNGAGTGPAAWSTRATSNPASCFVYVLTSSAVNPRPKADSRINWAALESWHSFCDVNNYRCDLVVDSDIDQDSLLTLIAQCGRALPVKFGGKYSVIVDREKSAPMQLITPRNSWDYSGSKAFPELPHGLKMSYINANLEWQADQVIVYADGYNKDGSGGKAIATTFEEITCKGVTSSAQAWKEGRYKMAATELRCETHQVTMDLEYITANIGDRALFVHDVIMVGLCPGTRITSVIKDASENVIGIRVDEELDIEAGKSYAVTVRTKIGLSTVGVVAPEGVTQELAFSMPIPGANGIELDNLVAFGESEKIAIDVLVMDIVPQADLTARLTLVDYAPEIFDLIDDPSLEIPDHDPMISTPGSYSNAPSVGSVYSLEKELATLRLVQQDLSGSQSIIGIPTDYPPNVTTLTARALRDAIRLTATVVPGTNARNTSVGLVLQRTKDDLHWFDTAGIEDGLTLVRDSGSGQYDWIFDRDVDGYPEAVDLAGWKYRVKSANIAGIPSVDWTYCDVVDASEYGTWLPAAPVNPFGSSSGRTAKVDWSDSPVYGLARYEIQIALESESPVWYAPALGLDVYASENNYRQDSSIGGVRHVSVSQFTHALPLQGQGNDPPDPQDTAYIYRVRAVSSRAWSAAAGCEETTDYLTAGPWTAEIPVLARPTGAYDVVQRSIGQAQIAFGSIFAEHMSAKNLAAVFAYIAALSGGVEDEHNQWILNDYPGRTKPVGYFRVGQENVGIEYDPATGKFRIMGVNVELSESDLTTYEKDAADPRSQTIENLGLVVRDNAANGHAELARLGAEKREGMDDWLWGGRKLGGEVEWNSSWFLGGWPASVASLGGASVDPSAAEIAISRLADGTVHVIGGGVDGLLREYIYAPGSLTLVGTISDTPLYRPASVVLPDGRMMVVAFTNFSATAPVARLIRASDGTWTTPVLSSFSVALGKGNLANLSNGFSLYAATNIIATLSPDGSFVDSEALTMTQPGIYEFASGDARVIYHASGYLREVSVAVASDGMITSVSAASNKLASASTVIHLSTVKRPDGGWLVFCRDVRSGSSLQGAFSIDSSGVYSWLTASTFTPDVFGVASAYIRLNGVIVLIGNDFNTGELFELTRTDGYVGVNKTVLERAGGGIVKIEEDTYGRKYTLFDGRTLRDETGTKNFVLPVGAVIPWFGSAIPTGWLLCNGQEHGSSVLQAILGSANVPDSREVSLVGAGTRASGVAVHDVFAVGQMKDDQFETHNSSHTHTAQGTYSTGTSNVPRLGGAGSNYSYINSDNAPPTSGRYGSVTRGKRLGTNYIIRKE